MKPKLITVEGNIGSGKTTLAEKLAADMDAHTMLESFADNPFLAKFYDAPEQHAFAVELFFMAERYEQLKQLLDGPELFQHTTITDYLFMKTLIFASINLQEPELSLYRRIFKQLYPSVPKPDLLLYIDAPLDKIQENIQKRGRTYEQQISRDYLQKVQNAYHRFLKQMQKEWPIIIIEAGDKDVVDDDSVYLKICSIAGQDHRPGIQYIRF